MNKLLTQLSRLFQFSVSALKGTEANYTKGSINKALALSAIPMVTEMIMESLFAIVDVYFGLYTVNTRLTLNPKLKSPASQSPRVSVMNAFSTMPRLLVK